MMSSVGRHAGEHGQGDEDGDTRWRGN